VESWSYEVIVNAGVKRIDAAPFSNDGRGAIMLAP
jgi:hypothetical protein